MASKVFGPLQKGTKGSLEFGVYGFNGGLNVKSVPQQVGDNDLTAALNVYLSVSGGLRMRNGMVKYGVALGSGPVIGLARFFQTIRAGAAVVPTLAATIGQVGSSIYTVETGALIGSIGANASPMTTVRAQDANDPSIAGLTDVLVICSGSGGPYVYDGTNLYAPAGWANAAGARWCAVVNGVVWFGGIPTNPRMVYGTGDGIVTSFESLPGFNVFLMSQPISGLATMGNGASAVLVMGMNTGIATLSGTGASNYVVQEVPSPDGCMAGRTMAVYDGIPSRSVFSTPGMMFYLGRAAIYQYDGYTSPSQMSLKVEPYILNDAYVGGFPMTQNRGASFSFVYNNRLYLGYCSGSSTPNTMLVYDFLANGWTVVQTTPGISSGVLLDAPGDASPAVCLVGSSSSGQVYTWDVEPGAGNVATDDGAAIITQFQSKFFPLGVPGTEKMVTRVYPEFFLSGPLQAQMLIQTDYGGAQSISLITNDPPEGSLWDMMLWDSGVWNGASAYQAFGPPASRTDVDELAGNVFSFGVTTLGATAPYVFGGLSGVFKQLGRSGAS